MAHATVGPISLSTWVGLWYLLEMPILWIPQLCSSGILPQVASLAHIISTCFLLAFGNHRAMRLPIWAHISSTWNTSGCCCACTYRSRGSPVSFFLSFFLFNLNYFPTRSRAASELEACNLARAANILRGCKICVPANS